MLQILLIKNLRPENILSISFEAGLVEERKLSNYRVVYLITQRGRRVLKYFKKLKQELPIIG